MLLPFRSTFGSLILALLLSPLLPCFQAMAQPFDSELGDVEVFLSLFPELRTLPSPAFLGLGQRGSFEANSAVIDPNPEAGAAGGGILQFDVIGMEEKRVLLFLNTYTDEGAGLHSMGQSFEVGLPALGPFWIHPEVLKDAERRQGEGLRITRSEKMLGDLRIQAIRFETKTSRGNVVFEVDSGSGLIFFKSLAVGNSHSQISLLAYRNLPRPFAEGIAPGWVQDGVSLEFRGLERTSLVGGGSLNPEEKGMRLNITHATSKWSLHNIQDLKTGTAYGRMPSSSFQLSGGLWLPLSVWSMGLSTEGHLLDIDPVTAAESYIGRLPEGNYALVQEVLPASRYSYIYEPKTGALVRIVQELQALSFFRETDLQLAASDDLEFLMREENARPKDPEPLPDAPNGDFPPAGPGLPSEKDVSNGGCSGGPLPWTEALLFFAAISFYRKQERQARNIG